MLNIRIISAILLFLFSFSANADVVKGRVIDSQTKDPLEGASLNMAKSQRRKNYVLTRQLTNVNKGAEYEKLYE